MAKTGIQVLLASDLRALLLLERVQITATAAKPYINDTSPDRSGFFYRSRREQRQLMLWQTQRILERFVPPEGYPHQLVGDHGIIRIEGIFVH